MSLLGCGSHLRVRRQDRPDLLGELGVGHSGLRRDRDLVELALLVEQALGRGEVEAGERGAADRRDRPELDESGDPEVLNRPSRLHADRVADLEVRLLRRRLVDHDLVHARPAARDERERIEGRVSVGDAEAEVGRAAVDDHLALLVDQMRVAVHATLGRGNARERANLGQECLVERRLLVLVLVRQLERGLAADHHARPLADVGEDRVEGPVDRVGQDECPAHHRDAEDDRDRGQGGAQLPPKESLEGEADHWLRSLITLRISALDACCSSLTSSPSARNRTRSAIAAALGSWVTMTVVCP